MGFNTGESMAYTGESMALDFCFFTRFSTRRHEGGHEGCVKMMIFEQDGYFLERQIIGSVFFHCFFQGSIVISFCSFRSNNISVVFVDSKLEAAC